MHLSRRGVLTGGPALLAARSAYAADYNPLNPGPRSRAADHHYDLVVRDEIRRRDIPLRIAHQAIRTRMPVILFSHAVGGSRHDYPELEAHWVARGYVTVFIQHPGMNLNESTAPIQDLATVLDALSAERLMGELRLVADRLDLTRIGAAGHEIGALMIQTAAGEYMPDNIIGSWPDTRIRAALMIGPLSLIPASYAKDYYGKVQIPWMMIHGTRRPQQPDPFSLPKGIIFDGLPSGQKYDRALDDAEFEIFDNPIHRQTRTPPAARQLRALLAVSTAFWDSTLRADPDAQAWLDGPGATTALSPLDRWQRK